MIYIFGNNNDNGNDRENSAANTSKGICHERSREGLPPAESTLRSKHLVRP
jgi:hypothetical protein